MKKTTFYRLIIVLLIALSIIGLVGCQENRRPRATVRDFKVASEINAETKEIITEQVGNFAAGTDSMHIAGRIEGLVAGLSIIKVEWCDQDDNVFDAYSETAIADNQKFLYSTKSADGAFTTGNYTASIYVDGRKEFVVLLYVE